MPRSTPPSRARFRRCPRSLTAARALLVASAFGVVLGIGSPASADIYVYTDADGTMHFTNSPNGDKRYRLYLKAKPGGGRTPRPGVVPVPPSDTSPERFTRYDEYIRQAAVLYQIPEELIRAVIRVESNYDPRAVSPAGAQGLMQLMPGTAQRMQVRDAFDPRENIFGGVRYLRILANLFNGDLSLTIAGYNAGEGAVMKHKGIPPYDETQLYVARVLEYYRRYRTIPDVVVASRRE